MNDKCAHPHTAAFLEHLPFGEKGVRDDRVQKRRQKWRRGTAGPNWPASPAGAMEGQGLLRDRGSEAGGGGGQDGRRFGPRKMKKENAIRTKKESVDK